MYGVRCGRREIRTSFHGGGGSIHDGLRGQTRRATGRDWRFRSGLFRQRHRFAPKGSGPPKNVVCKQGRAHPALKLVVKEGGNAPEVFILAVLGGYKELLLSGGLNNIIIELCQSQKKFYLNIDYEHEVSDSFASTYFNLSSTSS